MAPNQPGNGVVRWSWKPAAQLTWPAASGAAMDTKASDAEAVATGTGQPSHPLHPAQIDRGEQQHQGAGDQRHRYGGQAPLIDRGRRKQCGHAAGRHPAPPVTDAGQRGEDRAIGAEGSGAGGGDAADPVGRHQHQLGPAGRGRIAQQQAHDQQRDRRTALSRDVALAHEQRGDEKQALVAAAHRQRGRPEPSQPAWMRPRLGLHLGRFRPVLQADVELPHPWSVAAAAEKPRGEARARRSALSGMPITPDND